jgi:hypothetical protein
MRLKESGTCDFPSHHVEPKVPESRREHGQSTPSDYDPPRMLMRSCSEIM